MALSDGDKAECKEIARQIVKEVMVEHVSTCPHAVMLKVLMARMVGIGLGIGIASGGTMFGLGKLFGV